MKKRLLFLTPQLPYPPVSGGVIKSYRLLRYFSERYDVDLACITRPGDEMNIQAFQAQVPLRTALFRQAKLPRTAWNYLRSWVHGVPLSVYRNRCTELRQRIEALARNADAIFVDHSSCISTCPSGLRGASSCMSTTPSS